MPRPPNGSISPIFARTPCSPPRSARRVKSTRKSASLRPRACRLKRWNAKGMDRPAGISPRTANRSLCRARAFRVVGNPHSVACVLYLRGLASDTDMDSPGARRVGDRVQGVFTRRSTLGSTDLAAELVTRLPRRGTVSLRRRPPFRLCEEAQREHCDTA